MNPHGVTSGWSCVGRNMVKYFVCYAVGWSVFPYYMFGEFPPLSEFGVVCSGIFLAVQVYPDVVLPLGPLNSYHDHFQVGAPDAAMSGPHHCDGDSTQ